jgi:hypothetical protein
MPVKNPLYKKMAAKIRRSRKRVFLRADFSNLCQDYDQIGRGLRRLVADGRLVRIGYGLYAKAQLSTLTGKTAPTASLPELGREALVRLGVKPLPTKSEIAHASGRSTQVPTGRVIGVKSRIIRKIAYGGVELKYERI